MTYELTELKENEVQNSKTAHNSDQEQKWI